jgi:predicted NUDIX family phosphoesterase
VAIRETNKLEGRFAAPDEVDALGERLESWSRLCLEHLMAQVDS